MDSSKYQVSFQSNLKLPETNSSLEGRKCLKPSVQYALENGRNNVHLAVLKRCPVVFSCKQTKVYIQCYS